MNTALLEEETVLREGWANHELSVESVGGHLYLTSQRLVFECHKHDVQAEDTILALDRIESVEAAWAKFLNLIPVLPNTIVVHSHQGEEHFVVYERDNWVSAIREAIAAHKLG